jgi:hypothetical protein
MYVVGSRPWIKSHFFGAHFSCRRNGLTNFKFDIDSEVVLIYRLIPRKLLISRFQTVLQPCRSIQSEIVKSPSTGMFTISFALHRLHTYQRLHCSAEGKARKRINRRKRSNKRRNVLFKFPDCKGKEKKPNVHLTCISNIDRFGTSMPTNSKGLKGRQLNCVRSNFSMVPQIEFQSESDQRENVARETWSS